MKYTNLHGVPEGLVRAITASDYDPSKSQWNCISLTALIDSPKARMLKIRHWPEITEDVKDAIARFIGTSVHDKIADANRNAATESLSEERLYLNCDTFEVFTATPGKRVKEQAWYSEDVWFISMQFDSYLQPDEKTGILEDYKTTKAWTMVFDKDGKPGWEEQLNIEAYVLRKLGFPTTTLRNNLLFKDWSDSQAVKNGATYPQVPFATIKHRIWKDGEVEAYIRSRLRSHTEQIEKKDDDIPACTESERWAKQTTWAVMKEGRVSAVRVCDSKNEADGRCREEMAKAGNKNIFSVVERKGENVRCEGYCAVKPFCHFGRNLK
jgi:hypothetical protein